VRIICSNRLKAPSTTSADVKMMIHPQLEQKQRCSAVSSELEAVRSGGWRSQLEDMKLSPNNVTGVRLWPLNIVLSVSDLAHFHRCWGRNVVPAFLGYFAALLLAKKVFFFGRVLERCL